MLCGFFAVVALTLGIGGGGPRVVRRQQRITAKKRRGKRDEQSKTRAGDREIPTNKLGGAGTDAGRQQTSPGDTGSLAGDLFATQTKIAPALACGTDTDESSGSKNAVAATTNSRAAVTATVAGDVPPSTPPTAGSAAADSGKSKSKMEFVLTRSEPGLASFVAALAFAAVATLCKEVGVTVFGLLAGAEIVRFFEGSGWRQAAEVTVVSGEMAHFVTHDHGVV